MYLLFWGFFWVILVSLSLLDAGKNLGKENRREEEKCDRLKLRILGFLPSWSLEYEEKRRN
jgi:hypothetical protein